MYEMFFHIFFRFLLFRDFGWVTEFFQLLTLNLKSIEKKKENGKNFVRFVGNLSRIPKLSLILF